MGAFAAGEVVILPFPFSNLTGQKYRPALLLAEVDRGDWIACQITSNPFSDARAVELLDANFQRGGLNRASFARPGKLFTANESLFTDSSGALRQEAFESVRGAVVRLIAGHANS